MERLVFAVLSSIFVLIRIKFHQPEREDSTEIHAKRELISAFQFSMILLLSHGVWLFTPWFTFAEGLIPTQSSILGAAIMLIALIMLYAVHLALGSNFSARLEVQQNHALVQTGLYRYIRHPMYTSGFLYLIGSGMLSRNLIVLCLPLLSFSYLVFRRINDEERMLAERFQRDWKEYKNSTGRLFPRF